MHWIKVDGNVKRQTNLDRRGPVPIPKDCYTFQTSLLSHYDLWKNLKSKISWYYSFEIFHSLSHTHTASTRFPASISWVVQYRIHIDNLGFFASRTLLPTKYKNARTTVPWITAVSSPCDFRMRPAQPFGEFFHWINLQEQIGRKIPYMPSFHDPNFIKDGSCWKRWKIQGTIV